MAQFRISGVWKDSNLVITEYAVQIHALVKLTTLRRFSILTLNYMIFKYIY